MFRIELHDDETENTEHGTLAATIGRQRGIDYLYQVEMHLHEAIPEGTWRRAYVFTDNDVVCVWHRPPHLSPADTLEPLDSVLHVARSENYSAEWKPEFVDAAATKVTTVPFGFAVNTLAKGLAWAERQLADPSVATAIIMREAEVGRIFGAWERSPDGTIVLMSRAPGII